MSEGLPERSPGDRPLDLVCVGRCMVDLYCDQVGAPLESAQSLSMYSGGCPTNIAVGSARQGLRVGMLTRVGDDKTGRFLIETLRREGIDVSHVRTDPDAVTPMVMAEIIPPSSFALTWYRERAADLYVSREDFDDAFLASTRAVLVSGNSLSRGTGRDMIPHLIERCRRLGTRVVYDIDFRPCLWFDEDAKGKRHQVPPARIAEILSSILRDVDLLVGTEEEYVALTGIEDPREAFAAARERIPGMAILKLGKEGALLAERGNDPVPSGGFPVRVFNTLGAGDAFISGFLAGWLRDHPLGECLRRANASGAMVVTRHGCSPAMPYDSEIRHFLRETAPARLSPQDDAVLDRLHVAGGRLRIDESLCIFAIDHRAWFEDLGADGSRVARFKQQAVRAVLETFTVPARLGVILDEQYGSEAMKEDIPWIAEPLEVAGAFPLSIMAAGNDPALALRYRPRDRVVKLLTAWPAPDAQVEKVLEIQAACDALGRELLLEVLNVDGSTDVADAVARLTAAGAEPSWWKVPFPADEDAWQRLRLHATGHTRGFLFLGGGEPLDVLADRMRIVAGDPLSRGFAIGRSVFGEPFRRWCAGEDSIPDIAASFLALSRAWCDAARAVSARAGPG